MTEKELSTYRGKTIRVKCKDGDVVEGFCCVFTKALDNEPEVAEISLETEKYPTGLIGITLPEISSIEVMD